MAWFVAKLAVAYLLGALSGSLLLGRRRGLDVREHGSGNAGGTNALRVGGARFAAGVVAIDIGKGVLAALLGAHVAVVGADAATQAAACGFAAVIGHCWPVYFGFRGGKGAATAVGALAVLAPILLAPLLAVWLLVVLGSGYVGLATVLAGIALPLSALALRAFGIEPGAPLLAFATATALLLLFTHRANLLRLARGTEPRFRRRGSH